ncbi:hypothetical protein [Microbacterium sp. MM2322]|uniref:hypothetical protein n=1 Tax=Microbacterium sp. MM2322 TaxID=3157631 RepID=UPI003D806F55
MTDDQLKPADFVYSGIRSLAGWDRALTTAENAKGNRARPIGVLMSDVLLAGGEDRMPVAVAGKLDKTGTGHLAVLYSDVMVVASARGLGSGDGSSEVTVHSLRELSKIEARSRHNYYDGTAKRPRYAELQVVVSLDRLVVSFVDRGHDRTPLTDSSAVSAALDTLRAHLAR